MATNLPYNDSVFLFRLQTLIIDGGTEVVRNIFNNRLNNQPLATFLTNENATINRLRLKKTITKVQYDKLFPSAGRNPDSEDFDITLLMCLLTSIPSLGLNMKYPWYTSPAQTDLSIEADLIRLRTFRNEIAHASSTHCLDEPTYKQQWNKVEQCLLRLNSGPQSDPNLKATIGSFKNSPLDPATEQRLDKQWQELEKFLESEITMIKENIIDTRKNIGEVTGDVSKVKKDVVVVTEDVGKVKGDISNLKGGIGKVEGDIVMVTGDVGKLKGDISNLKGGIVMVTGDVGKVKKDISNLKGGIGKVEGDIVVVTGDVDKARGDICEMKGGIERIGGRVENLEEQVQNLDTKLSLKLKRRDDVSPEEESREVKESASSESKYNIRIQNLQEDLIDSYRSDHSKMSLAPLLDKSTPLLQFFQMPVLERVTDRKERGKAAKETRTSIDTWDKLLHHSDPRSTYVCADAGLGKTAFSKYLALVWCQSRKPLQEETTCFKTEHLAAIGKFRFVFLLFLRESQNSKCDLKDMIWEQLVSKRLRSHKLKDLERILYEEKCLIIVDGLDEWTHPSTCGRESTVPHWSKRENVTVITTTRPWKFDVARLKSGQVDQRIELTGLNQESANNLKYSFLSYFRQQELDEKLLSEANKEIVKMDVCRFTQTVSAKHASNLETVPLLLIYMLFLWSHGEELGETQCDLYCQILELLLLRSSKWIQASDTFTTEKIPHCFNERQLCLKFYPYLQKLGKLAFNTLLLATKEEKLVFDSCVAKKCLGEVCFKQCLKTGIISQSKCVQTHPLIQESTVSFSHKTMQEFFAALYMYSEPDDTRMSQLVLSKCKNVQDILDMSKIIMFISGMNVNVAALISCGMMNIINEDEITQKYRNTAEFVIYGNPLKDLQNMLVSCCKEMPCASGDNLYIEDVFIDESCQDEQYRVNLKQLIQNNKNNIKSVHIDMSGMMFTPYNSLQKVVEYFELKDLKNLVKISCEGEDTENIIPVWNTQVKCLELVGGSLLQLVGCSWSRSLFEKVTSLQKLEVIEIRLFTMSHSELRLLYDFISQRVDMRQILLWHLDCSDHKVWSSCSGLSLDLSQHSQLRELTLYRIPLSELNINMTSLERCRLEELSLSSLVFTHGTCDTVNSELNKSVVILWEVTIPASVLKDLVTVIQTLPHTVSVAIVNCDIKPESEWETLRQQIKKSKHFTVLVDNSGSGFMFKTIKHGN